MAAKLAMALSLVLLALAPPQVKGQETGTERDRSIPLIVPAGVPLRLYLTKRVAKRAHAPVEARLLAPLFAFDHEVIPSGTNVLGSVSSVQPVPKWERLRAVLGGDFTPLHVAEIEFTSLQLPDGTPMALHTIESPGLRSLMSLSPPKQRGQNRPVNNPGILGTAKQRARSQIDGQVARVRSIPGLVRGTNKREWLYDYAMSRLPYHPQSVRNRTRFDAVLRDSLDFGSEIVTPSTLALLGSQPAPGSIAHTRLLTPLDSMSSRRGDKVEAVLEQPLYSTDHRVVLPEGTHVSGSVSVAKKARWFHRGGQLRFDFQNVDLTPQTAELLAAVPRDMPSGELPAGAVSPPSQTLQFRTQATVDAAESGNAPIKVDKEGGVQATESKTRFIGTALALLVASRAADNEPEHAHGGAVTGQRSNVGGRTLGGGMGFGLLGSIASQSSPNVGAAFGYYGLAWSVYSTVIARGAEVQFDRNAVIDIGFNQRAPAGTVK